jgi:hypothetical protein
MSTSASKPSSCVPNPPGQTDDGIGLAQEHQLPREEVPEVDELGIAAR